MKSQQPRRSLYLNDHESVAAVRVDASNPDSSIRRESIAKAVRLICPFDDDDDDNNEEGGSRSNAAAGHARGLHIRELGGGLSNRLYVVSQSSPGGDGDGDGNDGGDGGSGASSSRRRSRRSVLVRVHGEDDSAAPPPPPATETAMTAATEAAAPPRPVAVPAVPSSFASTARTTPPRLLLLNLMPEREASWTGTSRIGSWPASAPWASLLPSTADSERTGGGILRGVPSVEVRRDGRSTVRGRSGRGDGEASRHDDAGGGAVGRGRERRDLGEGGGLV
eukprot:CAMPEP_0197464914 /NCGR_PEP_ID=MMETSP1175-20131217/64273_1 /TAXON_ID=1003142 /ORGANISM="Triceratium dubium, Strain CCMP147" /LENGTH=278 /DNA_ID=CAMNT_0043000917 /DNA_START=125 /DNA_END=958 /DNA_ORIENTATION=+